MGHTRRQGNRGGARLTLIAHCAWHSQVPTASPADGVVTACLSEGGQGAGWLAEGCVYIIYENRRRYRGLSNIYNQKLTVAIIKIVSEMCSACASDPPGCPAPPRTALP